MPLHLLAVPFVLLALARPAPAEPVPLGDEELDRVVAASAAAARGVGDVGVTPQVVLDPPRDPREFARWLRWRIACSLPGRVCIQG